METSGGRIELELFEDDAPNTVANFVSLVEKGFYNNTLFHRIIKGFMVQGGDPNGDGSGGPGYCIPDELQGHVNKHEHYSLSMAKRDPPNTGGSQFFIVTNPQGTPHLDKKHTVFGKVVNGFDVVDRLASSPVVGDRPNPDVKLLAATVLSKRSHPYAPWKTLPEPTAGFPRPKVDQKAPFRVGPRVGTPPKADRKTSEPKKAETPAGTKPETPADTKAEDKKPEERKAEEKKADDKKTEEKKGDAQEKK
ncbi:MAG: peptidylprolyl isomerase [Planctomycetota bacterium]|nr:peptidylprolyl isomerase [Planctomycetota bacterium]